MPGLSGQRSGTGTVPCCVKDMRRRLPNLSEQVRDGWLHVGEQGRLLLPSTCSKGPGQDPGETGKEQAWDEGHACAYVVTVLGYCVAHPRHH